MIISRGLLPEDPALSDEPAAPAITTTVVSNKIDIRKILFFFIINSL
jgi:hypothetical protein